MKYRFCGDTLQLVKYEISVTKEYGGESQTEIMTAATEAEKESLLELNPGAEVIAIDNSGCEWLNGKTFTQEQIKNGEIEKAADMGEAEYAKYTAESDPNYQLLDLDMRISLLETGVSINDLSVN